MFARPDHHHLDWPAKGCSLRIRLRWSQCNKASKHCQQTRTPIVAGRSRPRSVSGWHNGGARLSSFEIIQRWAAKLFYRPQTPGTVQVARRCFRGTKIRAMQYAAARAPTFISEDSPLGAQVFFFPPPGPGAANHFSFFRQSLNRKLWNRRSFLKLQRIKARIAQGWLGALGS